MLKISEIKTSNLTKNCITDEDAPLFSIQLQSDKDNNGLKKAVFSVNGWKTETDMPFVRYSGNPLTPHTKYRLEVEAEDVYGEKAVASMDFETGKREQHWAGSWITDGSYSFTAKGCSPVPMYFKKNLELAKKVKSAKLFATALGVYTFYVNGKRVGEDYFTPGFTSYKNSIQYQVYDITKKISGKDTITATVAGGWAVGVFTYARKNRVTANRQALLAEIQIEYDDGTTETIGTDKSWQVATGGKLSYADFYNGEIYDANVDESALPYHDAIIEKPKTTPKRIEAEYGVPTRLHEKMVPVSHSTAPSGEEIYDFGQNFAGIVHIKIKNAKAGQKVILHHAEVLDKGELCLKILRSAKATIEYTCCDGAQEYLPQFTYMGFRYVGLTGDIAPQDIELTAYALYSEIAQTGKFQCSDERINKLQSNIIWSSKSNFVDIPTDCPQRDERMGWTGDIALFAQTACFNFDMSRFLDKWLSDVRYEQFPTGGLPNTVPPQGHGFPITMPPLAVDFWGDACILVPWAEYQAKGDVEVLRSMYDSMKKYVKACLFWANFLSFGKKRYIWHTMSMLHFGDWVAPGVPKMSQWQSRSKWTATASLANTSKLLSKIAGILGKEDDEKYYLELSAKVSDAYESVLTDGGKLKKEEFQTAYVLPLYFDMFTEPSKKVAAERLNDLVVKNDYRIGTGFPGTPYILFALADNGYLDTAFKMLLCDKCPSWLFEVKVGGTTIWERWDAMHEDGTYNNGEADGTGGMVSFNHYAFGAVGDFLYRRLLGIEPTVGGYKSFVVKPLTGPLTHAEGEVMTPYGKIAAKWAKNDGKFVLDVTVPFDTTCNIVMPSGEQKEVKSGTYHLEEAAV